MSRTIPTDPAISARLAFLGCTVSFGERRPCHATTLTCDWEGRSNPDWFDAEKAVLGILKREYGITRYKVVIKNLGKPYTPAPITDPSGFDAPTEAPR